MNLNNTSSHNIEKINNYTYKLNINLRHCDIQTRNILYKSILKFVSHGFYNYSNVNEHDKNDLHIFFTCENIKTFEEYLTENNNSIDYENILNIINSLSIQINYLLEQKYGFYGIDKNDIIVLNNKYFVIIETNKLFQIEETYDDNGEPIYENLKINRIISIPFFYNPEIKNIIIRNKNNYKNISFTSPVFINYKCIYYSIGLLVVYSFLGLHKIGNIETDLKIIHSTKLYYFLERCFNDISDRHLLLI